MIKKRIIYFLLLVFVTACKKDNTTIHATVWDLSLNKPFEGAQVSLIERKSTLSWESLNEKIISTATTDGNGNCEFLFHAKFWASNTYSLVYNYDNYWDNLYGTHDVAVTDRVEINKKETNTVKLIIATYAEIKIIGNDTTAYDNNDNITVYAKNDYLEKKLFSRDGVGSITDIGYFGVLSGKEILRWDITKNNITTTYYGDTLFLAHNQKFDYTINY